MTSRVNPAAVIHDENEVMRDWRVAFEREFAARLPHPHATSSRRERPDGVLPFVVGAEFESQAGAEARGFA